MGGMPELKPCPFCGGPARIRKTITGWCVMCESDACGADVMFYAGDRKPVAKTVELWNTRGNDAGPSMSE